MDIRPVANGQADARTLTGSMTSSFTSQEAEVAVPATDRDGMTVAWFTYFPIEWLPDLPEHLRSLPRQHPATWQRVLLAELEKDPSVRLHVVVLRRHFPRNEIWKRRGVTFHLIKSPGGLRAPSMYWLDTWLVGRKLRQIRPDVVHAWGTESGAALVASRLSYPNVVTMQGLLNWLAESIRLDAYHWLAARWEARSLRRASLVTAESAFAVQYLRARYPHLDLHQVEHAPLPIFHQVKRHPQTSPARLLYVGAVSHGKGADVLFDALSRLTDLAWELVVIGGVDEVFLAPIKAGCPAPFWDRIRFRGMLTSEEVAEEMAQATLLVYPTRCDNSPNAVKEAVVAGVPVVASRVGGIVDYVWPQRNGALFPVGDAAACAQAIRESLRNPVLAQGRTEETSLNELRRYLSAESMTRRFLEVYRLAIKARRKRCDPARTG